MKELDKEAPSPQHLLKFGPPFKASVISQIFCEDLPILAFPNLTAIDSYHTVY